MLPSWIAAVEPPPDSACLTLHTCTQMFDLSDKHKEDVHAVSVPCKLNLAFCIIRMTELGEPLDTGSLDQASIKPGHLA